MTGTNPQDIEQAAQAAVEDGKHFVDTVSAMAEDNTICADEDIVSASGVKLLARGAKIDAHLREKLCGHRLAGTSLEKTLSIDSGASAESLAIDIARLIDDNLWLKRLAQTSGDALAMRHGTSRLSLPREILFRLTVAREQRPLLYRHLLIVTVLSHYLALRLAMNPASINHVQIAALCHDLGELYVAPEILHPDHAIEVQEWRFVDVHPIIGWLIVRDLPDIHAEAATAILQHHERLDGSGYPYHRDAASIGQMARLLAVADASASVMDRSGDPHRLTTMFRMSKNKLDAGLVNLMYEGMLRDGAATATAVCETLANRLTDFSEVLNGWARLCVEPDIGQTEIGNFLSQRINGLRNVMLQFGFDPDNIDIPLKLAQEDAVIAAELAAVVDELNHQFDDLGREYDRRSADWAHSIKPLTATLLADWRQQLKQCLDT